MSSGTKGNVDNYRFMLYIDSTKPKSIHAAEKLHKICHNHLIDAYSLEIIDLYENPALFERHRIIAVPTLDIETPDHPRRRFVGDLSQSEIFILAIGYMQEARKMGKEASDMREKIGRKIGRTHE
jgi:circadian clock protein KaiB